MVTYFVCIFVLPRNPDFAAWEGTIEAGVGGGVRPQGSRGHSLQSVAGFSSCKSKYSGFESIRLFFLNSGFSLGDNALPFALSGL